MILIDETKYSCMECIRGHRSSSCRHHTRPLLQVRSKGRPNVHANGNPNHRIAVFAEEISDDQKLKSPSPVTVEKCKKNPVIILKASPKQVIDLQSGQIVGPYVEDGSKSDISRPPPPVINSDSFINTSTCCGGSGISKPNKQCGCCSNKSKRINKSKILKTYISKQLSKQKSQIRADYETKSTKKFEFNIVKSEPVSSTKVLSSNDSEQIYDVVPVPSCSIPGSCCCDDSCSCEGCVVHGNTSASEISKLLPADFSLHSLNIDMVSNVNTVRNNLTNFNNGISDVNDINNNKNSTNGNQDTGANDSPDNLIFNSLPDDFSNYINTTLPTLAANPILHSQTLPSVPNLSGNGQKFDSPNEDDSPSTASCSCPPNECDCSNCETHGIINGHKLDELFATNNPMDHKMISFFTELSNPIDMSGFDSVAIKTENELSFDQFKQMFGIDQTPLANNGDTISTGFSNYTSSNVSEPSTLSSSSSGGCCSKK
ncbi:hypothetical protein G9P44_002786 [Scheffersomyces stipitis]|nr:hypothetical protein G9P44_002786 [Scheffersomyces stipitis]